jgi:hypothetical protein
MRLLPKEIQLPGVHFVSFNNLAGKEIKKTPITVGNSTGVVKDSGYHLNGNAR